MILTGESATRSDADVADVADDDADDDADDVDGTNGASGFFRTVGFTCETPVDRLPLYDAAFVMTMCTCRRHEE